MPSKKSSTSSSKKSGSKAKSTSGGKTVKKVSTKKKPAVKKKVAKKPVKKKAAVKKSAAKKTVAKARKEVAEAVKEAPIVTVTEKCIQHKHKPLEIQRRIVFVGTCSNCDHVPMRVSRLLALMSLIIFVLSGLVISQTNLPEIPKISFATGESLILIELGGK